MEFKDYYGSLGVDKKATPEDIHRAYRKLARKYHPDVNSDPKAEDRFKEITEAYEVLKDPEKRTTYDRFGSAFKQGGAGGGGPRGFQDFQFDFGTGRGGANFGGKGFSSFFETLFGGGQPFGQGGFGGFGAGAPQWEPEPQEATIELSLEEAFAGGSRDVTLTDPGTGRSKTYSINLPRGVKPGQKIRLPGRGGAGDVLLRVELLAHPRFRLEGRDLYCPLPISPWEAALGCLVEVLTLDGAVTVRIPPGTSSGRKIRLRGRGFPDPKGTDGDLYAEVQIVIPKKVSVREQELYEELARVSSFRPR